MILRGVGGFSGGNQEQLWGCPKHGQGVILGLGSSCSLRGSSSNGASSPSAPGIWASTHLLGVRAPAQGSWEVTASLDWLLPTGSPYILQTSDSELVSFSLPSCFPTHPAKKWVKNSLLPHQ